MLGNKSQQWNLWEFDGLPTIPWAFLQGICSTTNKYTKTVQNIKQIYM